MAVNGARRVDLVELTQLDPTLALDIRYAREDNFVGKAVYDEARAFLQRPAAEAVVRAHRRVREEGFGIVIYDGYRPWSVTKLFWDVTTPEQRIFVADPNPGSKHNRGCAVDLSLVDPETGEQVEMPSGFDEFTERAFADYPDPDATRRERRRVLRDAMESEGFTVNPNEWWHYDYEDWQDYEVLDVPFSAL